MLSSCVHLGLCEVKDVTSRAREPWGGGAGMNEERGSSFVSLRTTEDADLNINSQGPYRGLIIDYHWAFGATDIMCSRKNQLRGYYSAEALSYGSKPVIQRVKGFLKSCRPTEILRSKPKYNSNIVFEYLDRDRVWCMGLFPCWFFCCVFLFVCLFYFIWQRLLLALLVN